MNEEKRIHGYSEKLHELHNTKLKTKDEKEEREGSSNSQSREYQKKQTKRDIQSRAKSGDSYIETGVPKGIFGKISNAAKENVSTAAEDAVKFVTNHPLAILAVLLNLIVASIITCLFNSCSLAAGGVNPAIGATTFTADDSTILAVDENYSDLEEGINDSIESIESDYPGYDEYVYDLADIEHDPVRLAALLTVLYDDYSEHEVSDELQSILDLQYSLTLNPVTEIRTRTVTRWHWVTYTTASGRRRRRYESYEDEEEYEYKILNVTLTNSGIDAAVGNCGLTDDQLEIYEILLITQGNKEYLFE